MKDTPMLNRSDDAVILNTGDGSSGSHAREERIRAKSFPVAAGGLAA
jgi:hypothetical protein